MSQLFMRLTGAPRAADPGSFRIVDLSSPDFTPEQFANGWSACCESLNGCLWPRARFEREMRGDPMIREDGILFAVAPDGQLASTASVQFGRVCPYVSWDYSPSGTLHMVGTRKGFSGRGAGLAVCRAAADYAFRNGAEVLYLTTDDFRLPAIKIYLKLGFSAVLYDEEQLARWRSLAGVLSREIPCVIP